MTWTGGGFVGGSCNALGYAAFGSVWPYIYWATFAGLAVALVVVAVDDVVNVVAVLVAVELVPVSDVLVAVNVAVLLVTVSVVLAVQAGGEPSIASPCS